MTIPNIDRQIFGNAQAPIDYFNNIFTNELRRNIMVQTNLYAKEQIEKIELSTRSVWKDISYEEMSAYFGVILNMGAIYLSDIKLYFS
jgi:hypothetical protein